MEGTNSSSDWTCSPPPTGARAFERVLDAYDTALRTLDQVLGFPAPPIAQARRAGPDQQVPTHSWSVKPRIKLSCEHDMPLDDRQGFLSHGLAFYKA